MWQDIRVAWRFLRRARTSTAIAVITLGVTVALCGIAVATLDEMLRRPLAYPASDGLVTIYGARAAAPRFQTLSYLDYSTARDRARDAVDLAGFVRVFHTLSAGSWPERLQGELVSGNYFGVLGVRAYGGRLISPDDDRIRSGHAVIVLAHDLWRRTLASDPAIVGRIVTLNRHDYTVIGIAPPGFHGPAYQSQFWIPLAMAPQSFGGRDLLAEPRVPLLQTVGRLNGNSQPAQAQGLVETLPTAAASDGWRLQVLPAAYLRFWPGYRETVTRFLAIFAGLTLCVLVIASANLAGLLLARSSDRERDLAVRRAIGATSWQLTRRLLAESLVLTLLGGFAGVALVLVCASAVTQIALPVPATIAVTPDAHLIAVTLAVCLLASTLFTAVFAIRGVGRSLRAGLAAAATAVAPAARVPRGLAVLQIAASCVCMTGAGLLLRSAIAVSRIDVGFDTSGTVSGRVGLGDQTPTSASGLAFYDRLEDALLSEPAVDGVALEWNPALGAVRSSASFVLGDGRTMDARYNVIGARYFATMRVPLLAGREFRREDREASEPVAIVNETLAARIGGLDGTVRLAKEPQPRRVVGIVRDVKYNGITEPAQPFVYLPLAQAFRAEVWVHVRSRGADPESLLRNRLHALDPQIPLSNVHSLSAQLDDARATPRISAQLSAGIAALAVFLALVGVYGLLASTVAQRRRELSIRAALGASPQDIMREVAAMGLRLTVIGFAVGMPAAAAASTLLASLLYGVSAHDPLVFATVPALVLAVSVPSWLVPARRAAHASPVEALKLAC